MENIRILFFFVTIFQIHFFLGSNNDHSNDLESYLEKIIINNNNLLFNDNKKKIDKEEIDYNDSFLDVDEETPQARLTSILKEDLPTNIKNIFSSQSIENDLGEIFQKNQIDAFLLNQQIIIIDPFINFEKYNYLQKEIDAKQKKIFFAEKLLGKRTIEYGIDKFLEDL